MGTVADLTKVIHLIYTGAAAVDFDDDQLAELLRASRAANAEAGVTGMLLYVDGTFFHVLEGEAGDVERVFARIEADPRHGDLTVIVREPIPVRSFAEWSMGFGHISAAELRSLEGANGVFGDGDALAQLDDGRARKLLEAFTHGRWRVTSHGSAAASLRSVDGGEEDVPSKHEDYTFAYQPIVDVRSQRVASYEALVRGPRRQSAAWILDQYAGAELLAFDHAARLRAVDLARGLDLSCRLNLNLCADTLAAHPTTLDDVADHAEASGIDPSRLVIEISETEAIRDPEGFAALIAPIRGRGVRFAIDDFGAGYSGLNLLAEFQPASLKLDRGLIRGIDRHGPRQAIIRGLVRTCGDLGIDVVAEGIETVAEHRWVTEAGIDLQQGFLFARPGFERLPEPHFPLDYSAAASAASIASRLASA